MKNPERVTNSVVPIVTLLLLKFFWKLLLLLSFSLIIKKPHLLMVRFPFSSQSEGYFYAGGTGTEEIIIMAFGVVSFLSGGTPIYQSVTV